MKGKPQYGKSSFPRGAPPRIGEQCTHKCSSGAHPLRHPVELRCFKRCDAPATVLCGLRPSWDLPTSSDGTTPPSEKRAWVRISGERESLRRRETELAQRPRLRPSRSRCFNLVYLASCKRSD